MAYVIYLPLATNRSIDSLASFFDQIKKLLPFFSVFHLMYVKSDKIKINFANC